MRDKSMEEDDELETTIEYMPPEETVSDEITTGQVSQDTMLFCPKCNIKSYFKDGSCVRCDRGLI
jgi:hypothetical protein